jgi:hypothetical protein
MDTDSAIFIEDQISKVKILDLYQNASFFCLYFAAEPQRYVRFHAAKPCVQKQLRQGRNEKITKTHFDTTLL